jgi:hypothetical protein
VGARGQADDQQASLRVAERGNRLAPIGAISIGAPFLSSYLFAESNQPRTFFAGDHLLLEYDQFARGLCL